MKRHAWVGLLAVTLLLVGAMPPVDDGPQFDQEVTALSAFTSAPVPAISQELLATTGFRLTAARTVSEPPTRATAHPTSPRSSSIATGLERPRSYDVLKMPRFART